MGRKPTKVPQSHLHEHRINPRTPKLQYPLTLRELLLDTISSPLTSVSPRTFFFFLASSDLALIALSASAQPTNSTFQLLAEGTQDLAALVGLFATDSVERYAVDYTKGFLGPAMSMCSLLGILGYARAMVKLALGLKHCENAGFPTTSVRPILGVNKADKVPAEDLVRVTYVTKVKTAERGDRWGYSITKSMLHTEESCPSLWIMPKPLELHSLDTEAPTMLGLYRELRHGRLLFNWELGHELPLSPQKSSRQSSKDKRIRIALYINGVIWLTLAATVTSLAIIPISAGAAWTWTKVMGSFGLLAGLTLSAVSWFVVYMKQTVPFHAFESSAGTLDNPRNFAFWRPTGGRLLGSRQAVVIGRDMECSSRLMGVLRVVSMVSAILISLGYLCQYIEIRKLSKTQVGGWLGWQAFLALIRLAVWIIGPNIVPCWRRSPQHRRKMRTTVAQAHRAALGLYFSILHQWIDMAQQAEYLRILQPGQPELMADLTVLQLPPFPALRVPQWVTKELQGAPIVPLLEQMLQVVQFGIPSSVAQALRGKKCWYMYGFPTWLAKRTGRAFDTDKKMACYISSLSSFSCFFVATEANTTHVTAIPLLKVLNQQNTFQTLLSTSDDGIACGGYVELTCNYEIEEIMEATIFDSHTTAGSSLRQELNTLMTELQNAINHSQQLEGELLAFESLQTTVPSEPKSSLAEHRRQVVIEIAADDGKESSATMQKAQDAAPPGADVIAN
ncbi:hypothetical protein BDZ91DRAFT_833198 [Kalaharituber pfeilii]|nr:hypothetical protein BDZ91DRAFT_833198 [Kalaharituber pfeilii]